VKIPQVTEMPVITNSCRKVRRALIKEQTEAKVVLQADLTEDPPELLKLNLSIGKVVLDLQFKQMKLTQLEAANAKLIEALEHSEDSEATEQFKNTLHEESEMIDDVISKILQLKVMKEETKENIKS